MKKLVRILKGYRTIIAAVTWVAYEWAVAKGHLPLIHEIRFTLVGSILVFFRQGVKQDTARAVKAIKEDEGADALRP